MKLSLDEILETVRRVKADRADYNLEALDWERMWTLELFEKSRDESVEEDGKEQITLPTPYNVVNLAERLITTNPDIVCPPSDATDVDDADAALRQKWLKAMWQRANKQARRNVIGAAWWQALVRGRGAFDVRWVEESLPKRFRQRRMPIHIRTIDPLNCGFVHGELFTEVAYHRYFQTRLKASHRYPELKDKLYERKTGRDEDPGDYDEVEILDYWYVSFDDGSIWNAIIVDGIFAKEPVKTSYIDLPIVEFYGDDAPASEEKYKSLSILFPIRELWKYQSTLVSQIATGNLWYFWPHWSIQNEFGMELPDRPIRPGETQIYPYGTKIEAHQMQPNVPIAEKLLAITDQYTQQSTFPGVLYGQEPGSLQAGYGVSLLSSSAEGRVSKPRRNLETAIEIVNEIALGLVEEMADDEGVSVWGDAPEMGGIYSCTLAKININGIYDNRVRIDSNLPMEELQKMTLGMRAVEGRIISKQTYRNLFMRQVLPDDEERRVQLEQALENEEYRPYVFKRTLDKYFGPDWEQARRDWMDNYVLEMAARNAAAQQIASGQQPGPQPGPQRPPMPMDQIPSPQSPAMADGAISPMMEGQLTPEALGVMPGQLPPEAYQALVDTELLPAEEAAQMMRSAMGGGGQ